MTIVDSLLLFTITGYVFAYVYLEYRQLYKKNIYKERHVKIKKSDILVPTTALIVSLFLIFLIFIYLFNLVGLQKLLVAFDKSSFLIITLYFLVYYLFAFSNGLYLYTILMETLVVKRIRLSKYFLRIYQFFYGPVSNILVYFFGGLIFLLNGILEYQTRSEFNLRSLDFLKIMISGILFGVLYYYAAIVNETWRDQIKTAIFLFLIHITFAIGFEIDYQQLPFNLFFLVSISIYLTLLLVKHYFYSQSKEVYPYDWIDTKSQ